MPSRRSLYASAIITVAASFAALTQSALAASTFLSQATDLGPMNQSSPVQLTVWLKLHDATGLQNTIAAQHDGGSGWLTEEQIRARHAPSAADVAAVSKFLTERGLKVDNVGINNLFVRASGSAAQVDSALSVELHQFNFRGTTFHASKVDPKLPSNISPLIASVGGLSDLGARPNVVRTATLIHASRNVARASDAEHAQPRPVPLAGAGANGFVFSPQCFYPPSSVTVSGPGVTATYTGQVYGASINNTALGTVAPCGYQPSDIWSAYNMTPLFNHGLDGTGETIAIVDAYGSTTVAADLAAFSQVMGLPAPQMTIVGTPTESAFSGTKNSGWADETTLDVEWVHSIAPGAKILLVVAPTNSFDDLFNGIAQAAATPGVVAISNSWSGNESQTDIPTRQAGDSLLMLAGARGESVNFATGDSGNEAINLGYVDVNYPASSPYATGVGGVSVGLDAHQHINFQTSWGNNITELADTVALGSPPIDPPLNEGFLYGGGGGVSNVYAKPSFQRGLDGQRRLVPDISWVADPYTGVEIVITLDAQGDQYVESIGGTSLATPMFSALWGIANQRAHHRLGLAAPYVYRMGAPAIMDVQATPSSPENVTGVLTDANGTQKLTSWDLSLPLQGQQSFFSALYQSPYSTRWFVLTFGVDSTLQAGPGWDPATGVGTPNGWWFVQSFGQDD